jgi:hypothetical protein
MHVSSYECKHVYIPCIPEDMSAGQEELIIHEVADMRKRKEASNKRKIATQLQI